MWFVNANQGVACRDSCNEEEACSISWKTLDVAGRHACAEPTVPTYLPVRLVDNCDRSDAGLIDFQCAEETPSLCAANFDACEPSDLPSLHMKSLSALVNASSITVPSGPYSSALSAAITSSAANVHNDLNIVGRAAVTGFFVWSSEQPCSSINLQNSSSVTAEIRNALNSFEEDDNILSGLASQLTLLLQSRKCDLPNLREFEVAVPTPPWLPATHFEVQMYVLGNKDSLDHASSNRVPVGRRLLQQDDSDDSSSCDRAEGLLQLTLASPGAQAVMHDVLKALTDVLDLAAFPVDNLLPDVTDCEHDPPGKPMRIVLAVLISCAVVLGLIMIAVCCSRRQRRQAPSPTTYVNRAEGAAEPMLPIERREQLKGLLKFLRKKRTEELIDRPFGEPVEIGPEPPARTKVENIVKALLCASAPGVVETADFPYDPDPCSSNCSNCCGLDLLKPPRICREAHSMRRSVLTTRAERVKKKPPQFEIDEATLLKRLVLKGPDAKKPAAARLSSVNDHLFNGDPFGIYTTVQFQTNLWEMLLSYREVRHQSWHKSLCIRMGNLW